MRLKITAAHQAQDTRFHLSIEVYGQVSEAVIARLGEKARMLGSGTVTLHEFYAGFARQLLSLRR